MNRAFAHIRNRHALLRLVRPAPAKRWSALSEPVFPNETAARARAQSLLAGITYRDGSTNPDTLTLSQAQDVLRWATTRIR